MDSRTTVTNFYTFEKIHTSGKQLDEALQAVAKAFGGAAAELADGLTRLTIQMQNAFDLKNSLLLTREQYVLMDAPPDEVVDHIVSQPNHTWHGLTIYPDEAWRYRGNDYWMEWRR